MADVSCSVPLPKKISNASDVSSKHIYDGVFSARPATKRNSSTFSFRVDDYRQIFSPSDASLGPSIPILDLPAVDRSDSIGGARSSGVDYAGVFGSPGDDNRIGLPAEELFRESKKNAKRDVQPPRASMQTKILVSKSQEFPRNFGNNQISKSPVQTRITAKSQEFYGSVGSNQTSTSASSDQPFDGVKQLNVSHHKTSQLVKDGTDGMTHIAHFHAVPGYTHLIDEVDPAKEIVLDEAKQMSMVGADLGMDVGNGKKQGKHTRAVSDLGADKQASDHDAGLQREFHGGEFYMFDASCSMGEANCKSQTYSVPTLSTSDQSFGSNDYFRSSSSQRSWSSTNNHQSNAAANSSSPSLEEELDVNSAAAVSAAAMKRAIEEAEAKIRCAKEFLKGQEGNGSVKLSFKDSFKAKPTSDINHSYEACMLKQNGNLNVETTRQQKSVDGDILKKKDNLNTKATNENDNCIEAGKPKPKDGLNVRATPECQIADEPVGLKVKLHGFAPEVDTGTKTSAGLRSTCSPETFEEAHDSMHQPEFVNAADLEDKISSNEMLKSAEKSCKHEGGGEWEAAKHLSQLISGVKNRLVSFISKPAGTEKIVIQEDTPNTSGSLELSEGSAYQVQDVDAHVKRSTDGDYLEKEVEMDHCARSGLGESAQHSNRRVMEMLDPEENEVKSVPLEQGKVEEVRVSLDVEMPISKQCDPSDPEEELERIQVQDFTEVRGKLIREDVQHQNREILDDSVEWEYEKGQMNTNELEECNFTPEATYESRGDNSREENESWKEVQDQETVEKGVDESFNGEDGNWRQVEGCSWGETEKPKDSGKKLGDIENKLIQEDVQDQSQEILDVSEGWEYEEGQINHNELETPEATYQSKGYDSEEETNCNVKNEMGKEVQVQETVEKAVDKSFNGEDGNWSQEKGCSWRETEMPEDSEKKLEDVEMVQETGTEELQDKGQAADLCTREEDNKAVEQQEVKSKAKVHLIEVADDTSDHDKNHASADNVCEHDQSLFLGKNEGACLPKGRSQYSQDMESSFEDKERMAELATTSFESKVNVVQPISLQIANQLVREDTREQTQCFIEVADNISVHDDYFPATDDIREQDEQSSLSRNEASGHDDGNQYPQDVVFTFEKEQIAESTESNSETKGSPEHPSSAHAANDLIGNEMCEQTGSSIEVADVTLDHVESAPQAICNEEEDSSLNRNDEPCGQHDRNECVQDVKFSSEDERMPASTAVASEPERDVEQTSSGQTVTKLIGEEMIETETPDEDSGDFGIIEEETEEANEVLSHTDVQNNESETDLNFEQKHADETFTTDIEPEKQGDEVRAYACETDLNFEQKHADEETFTIDVGPENQGDESEVRTYERETDLNFEQNHAVEETFTTDIGPENLGDESEVRTYERQTFTTDIAPEKQGDVSEVRTYERETDLNFEQNHAVEETFTTDIGPENLGDESEVRTYERETDLNFEQEHAVEETFTADIGPENQGDESEVRTYECETDLNFEQKHADQETCTTDIGPENQNDESEVRTYERETDLNFEQKHADQETFTTDIGPENQGDESEVRTYMGEFEMASDQDKRMHDVEISHKRKRWFDNREEVGEFHLPGILGDEITLELDQENANESKIDDILQIHLDEMVNESGEGTNVMQADAGSGLEDGHSTEATHRRKRWFENRVEETLHKPSVFDGAGIATELDDEIAEETELDDYLRNCVNRLENEGKEDTDAKDHDVVTDQVESRASAEAAHRRRRWFENREKTEPAQRPTILEDNGVNTDQEEEIDAGAATASNKANKRQSQLNNREREKEKERIAVERAIREARQRAFAEAQERAAVEARQKAAAASQDRQGKISSEAKSASDKASMDAKLRAERAAVERATAEARERALQKAMSEKAAYMSRDKDPKNQSFGSSSSGYSSASFTSEKSNGPVTESPQRRKAISERNKRTMERAAKALEEKNTRDLLAQKEQAERNRFADALDAEVKRWLNGKEGNLRALLSTLQYILGPDSGWQPIPLTDLVSSTAVRKAYKRAALCVHPDKLQQRGATIQQKYICEKVYDLLKDAWQKFNPDDW